jgi:hypothetical protein
VLLTQRVLPRKRQEQAKPPNFEKMSRPDKEEAIPTVDRSPTSLKDAE